MIITTNTPYEKVVEEYVYNTKGRQTVHRQTEFDNSRESSPVTAEYYSVYKDTFLVKQLWKAYDIKKKILGTGEIILSYEKEPPFKRLWRLEKNSKGQEELEQYFYTPQSQLDSISFLSNDSSYSNGIRYSGNNLYYKEIKPQKTEKYYYDPNGKLSEHVACTNYYRPLNSQDSAGCLRTKYDYDADTIIGHVTQWNFQGRKLSYVTKQLQKDGWTIYQESGFEEQSTTEFIFDDNDLLRQEIITNTSNTSGRRWQTKISYRYFFRKRINR